MKLGIIGSGRIGSTVGKLWAHAGHHLAFTSRHPEQLAPLVREIGHGSKATSISEAVAFGEVILLAVPFAALPDLGASISHLLSGKVVLETANPYPPRDGKVAEAVIQSGIGTGPAVAKWFPEARIVRAFNSVWDQTLAKEAHRQGSQIGIPLASDDQEALSIASQLVRDAGFEPVVVGGLVESRRFDVGTPVYNTGMDAEQLRKALGVSVKVA